MSKNIFYKEYDYESLYDLGRDIAESMDEECGESALDALPKDEHGYAKGRFIVSIIWEEE